MPLVMETWCQTARYYICRFRATLISSPQLASEGNMNMVHSKRYGSFMQPASCPICTPHADRIMIASSAIDMSISITPYATHTFLGKSEQALPLTNTPCNSTSENTIDLINLGHVLLGGLSFKRLQALTKLHLIVLKLPLQASFNGICSCCQCSSMRKSTAWPSMSRKVSPPEEVHFVIFTFNGHHTVYLIDRGSQAEFTYFLDKKSDLPKALQQFLIDCNTASFHVRSLVQ